MADLGGVLNGTTVVDCGLNIAGPACASLLADLGADVIKVEAPTGDTSRTLAPSTGGVSTMFATMNRNKRGLGLDLRHPDAAPVLKRLLENADVVVQNLRPGKAGTLGLSAEQVHEINPRVVHVSIEAFYPSEGSRPGYDLLVQAETGMMSLTGDPDRPPSRLPGSLLDHVTGLWSALGVVAALHGPRDRVAITLSMSDIALHLLGDRVAAYLATGNVPGRMGSAIGVTTPLQAYPTDDGDIVIGAASDALFRRLAEVVDPDLATDATFATQTGRLDNREVLNDRLTTALSGSDSDTWLKRLDDAGVPAARIRDLGEATERHRHLSATGLVPVDGVPGLELVANPLLDEPKVGPPFALGGDSAAVLAGLGFSDGEVAALLDCGAVVCRG
jgi:crotonobetainyl-CoA:carnitine CoA-transferase CaiB-like acyl-CoA transferase